VRRRGRGWSLGLATAASLAAATGDGGSADARSTGVLPYPAADVWPAAVRFLRVDRGFPIKEKDEATGYVLFEYLESGKSHRSSLELVRAADADGRDATQIVVSVADLPSHYELTLIEKLGRKVRDERGQPPRPAPRPKPPTSPSSHHAPDAGAAAPR